MLIIYQMSLIILLHLKCLHWEFEAHRLFCPLTATIASHISNDEFCPKSSLLFACTLTWHILIRFAGTDLTSFCRTSLTGAVRLDRDSFVVNHLRAWLLVVYQSWQHYIFDNGGDYLSLLPMIFVSFVCGDVRKLFRELPKLP